MLYQPFLLAAGWFLLQTYGKEVDEEGLVFEHFTFPTPNPSISPISWGNDGHPPVIVPSVNPTVNPILSPSESPVWKGDAWKVDKWGGDSWGHDGHSSQSPSNNPSSSPTLNPTLNPTLSPTLNPTVSPSLPTNLRPTASSIHDGPSNLTLNPTLSPTLSPTLTPTASPFSAIFVGSSPPTDSPTTKRSGVGYNCSSTRKRKCCTGQPLREKMQARCNKWGCVC